MQLIEAGRAKHGPEEVAGDKHIPGDFRVGPGRPFVEDIDVSEWKRELAGIIGKCVYGSLNNISVSNSFWRPYSGDDQVMSFC